MCTDNLIKTHKMQTNAYTGLCMAGWCAKPANDRHREVTTAFFSLPVMQAIGFPLALVGNDIIGKRAWNCFHIAHPNLSACQSRPMPALLCSRNCKAACKVWGKETAKILSCFRGFCWQFAARHWEGSARCWWGNERVQRRASSLTKQIAENHWTAREGFRLAAFLHKPSNPAKTLAAAPYLGGRGSVEHQ